VPIYDTFGEKECQYIVEQAELQVIFVSKDNLENMLKWTKTIPSVKKIIVWGTSDLPSSEDSDLPSSEDLVISYEKCLEKDAEAGPPNIASPPKPEDLAIIMYTSGTT
jgi:long-subunit acyl-CoA synthetase (AMP-forming)